MKISFLLYKYRYKPRRCYQCIKDNKNISDWLEYWDDCYELWMLDDKSFMKKLREESGKCVTCSIKMLNI